MKDDTKMIEDDDDVDDSDNDDMEFANAQEEEAEDYMLKSFVKEQKEYIAQITNDNSKKNLDRSMSYFSGGLTNLLGNGNDNSKRAIANLIESVISIDHDNPHMTSFRFQPVV